MRRVKQKRTIVLAVLGGLLGAVSLFSLGTGTVEVPVSALLAMLAKQLGLSGTELGAYTQEQWAVIWHIRLPRILVGILVGAALGVSGGVMQGVFSNPLADPGIIGVSAGASFGAVVAVSLGLTAASMYYMPILALVGALVSVAVTVSLASKNGKIPVMTLLLAGVAVSMFLSAMTSGILTFMNEYRLREFLFWMVGGLDFRRWEHVFLAAGPVLVGITVLTFLARHLNVLVLGEDEAKAVGMPVVLIRLILLFVASLTTAAAVCVSGSIGFVGLVVPHIMRLLLGPEHRTLLPACALAGALFLISCDTLGRLVAAPAEIRVGIVTALTGAPYFLFLLRKAQKGGGWS